MRLRFFNKYEVQRRSFLLFIRPSCMKVEKLDYHVDEVLEAQTIVSIRKSVRFVVFSYRTNCVVDARTFAVAHYRRRSERRLNEQPRIAQARVPQLFEFL